MLRRYWRTNESCVKLVISSELDSWGGVKRNFWKFFPFLVEFTALAKLSYYFLYKI